MILRIKKITFFVIFICLLYLLAGLLNNFTQTAKKPNAWIQQANKMRQVGIILCSYLENHDGVMPKGIYELKGWATDQPEFKDSIYSPIWKFKDPSTNKEFNWKLAFKKYPYSLYAPTACLDDKYYKSKRLVLIKCERGEIKYGFVDETKFQKEITQERNK